MKMMQGADFRACSNRSLTLAAPTPTNISTNSDPDMEKNGTPASPATARASRVLPVPGGPVSNTPFGTWAPSSPYFSWSLRNDTISSSSILASSTPATSLKLTPVSFSTYTFALDLPMFNMPPMPCLSAIRRNTNIHKPKKIAIGTTQDKRVVRKVFSVAPVYFTPTASSSPAMAGSTRRVWKCVLPFCGVLNFPAIRFSETTMSVTCLLVSNCWYSL